MTAARSVRALCLAVFLSLFPVCGQARASGPQKIYVAANGSNSNPGTIDKPLQTLAAAVAQLQNLGTIIVAPGTYPVAGPLVVTQSGVSILARNDTPPILQYT